MLGQKGIAGFNYCNLVLLFQTQQAKRVEVLSETDLRKKVPHGHETGALDVFYTDNFLLD